MISVQATACTENQGFAYTPYANRQAAGTPQAVIGAGASAVPEIFPNEPDADPRQIAEKYDHEQEHDRDRFALH